MKYSSVAAGLTDLSEGGATIFRLFIAVSPLRPAEAPQSEIKGTHFNFLIFYSNS